MVEPLAVVGGCHTVIRLGFHTAIRKVILSVFPCIPRLGFYVLSIPSGLTESFPALISLQGIFDMCKFYREYSLQEGVLLNASH